MPRIHIQTEQVYRNRTFYDETRMKFISADEVLPTLKREDGLPPDEHYIVLTQRPSLDAITLMKLQDAFAQATFGGHEPSILLYGWAEPADNPEEFPA